MKHFAALYRALDETTKTTRKLAAMKQYFTECDAVDGAWAVYFLSGPTFKAVIPTGLMRQWCAEAAGLSDWMFEECYGATGDLAEAMSLVLPDQRPRIAGQPRRMDRSTHPPTRRDVA